MENELIAHLSALPMPSIIEWYTWEDSDGEFEYITFNDAVDIALDWFESLDDFYASRLRYLSA